jgi:hypothetical protein
LALVTASPSFTPKLADITIQARAGQHNHL